MGVRLQRSQAEMEPTSERSQASHRQSIGREADGAVGAGQCTSVVRKTRYSGLVFTDSSCHAGADSREKKLGWSWLAGWRVEHFES